MKVRTAMHGAALAGALMLAACGDGETTVAKTDAGELRKSADGDTMTFEAKDGGSATMSTGGAAMDAATSEIAASLPAFAPLYPGAKVVSTISGSDGGGGSGAVITLETPDPMADVLAFYDARIADAGAESQMKMDQPQSAMRAVADKEGGSGTMILVSDGGANRTITLTVGQDGKG